MEYVVISFVSFILGAYLVWKVKSREIQELEEELELEKSESREATEVGSSFAGYNERMAEIKEEKKKLILEEIDKRGILQINEIVTTLKLSRSTAYRYLEELEVKGKVVQVGKFGRSVGYKRVI